jgi:hypothetical protein
MATKQQAAPATLEIPELTLRRAIIRITGTSSLICHAWSAKAKKQMLDKQMKTAEKSGKEAKDPQRDFEESLYPMPEGSKLPYGFPSVAVKAAVVDACSQLDGITKVQMRGTFHIDGELLGIIGVPTPREDMVRVGMGTADIRFRGEFKAWAIDVPIRFNPNVLSIEQISNAFRVGGFAVGIGEWRPQRDGSHGMFDVSEVTLAK